MLILVLYNAGACNSSALRSTELKQRCLDTKASGLEMTFMMSMSTLCRKHGMGGFQTSSDYLIGSCSIC